MLQVDLQSHKARCILARMMTHTVKAKTELLSLQQIVDRAVAKAGGQKRLAQLIAARFGVPVTQQTIAYLQSRGRADRRPATRSVLTPFICAIAGLSPTYVPKPVGNKRSSNKVRDEAKEPLRVARMITVQIIGNGKATRMEFTREALKLAKWFMDLDVTDRADILEYTQRKRDLAGMLKVHDDHHGGGGDPPPDATPLPAEPKKTAKFAAKRLSPSRKRLPV